MAVDERGRHALHEAARRELGDEEAATLMELLPPVGWADVATKRDLDVLRVEMEALRHELYGAMDRLTSRLLMWLVPTMLAGMALAATLARIG